MWSIPATHPTIVSHSSHVQLSRSLSKAKATIKTPSLLATFSSDHMGLEMPDALEIRAFLSEAHRMSNTYFKVFLIVVSHFYMTFSQFLSFFYLIFCFFSSSIGMVRAFLELKQDKNRAGGAEISKIKI